MRVKRIVIWLVSALMSCLLSAVVLAVDADGDGSDADEEALAGTSDSDPGRRPYWEKTFNGDDDFVFLGSEVRGVGDVNNDGYDDVIIGSGHEGGPGVYVYSGVDYSLLYTFYSDIGPAGRFLSSVSGAGDVNADGYADLIVSDYYADNIMSVAAGSARIFSGIDGSLLYNFRGDAPFHFFGYSVSGAGDINADGYADIIVGACPDSGITENYGYARVFSGVDGSQLYEVGSNIDYDHFGCFVSGAGDINNDGYDDFLVGIYRADMNGTDSGSVKLFSGINGSMLYAFHGDSANDHFGRSVSGVGDVNQDGYADFVVGAWQDDNNGTNSGSVRVYSGHNGAILYMFNGDSAGNNFGRSVSGAGDVNHDGYADITASGNGSTRVFSGISGSVLYTFSIGGYVVSAGDLDNDGYVDFIAGDSAADNNGDSSGSAQIILSVGLMNDVDMDFMVNNTDWDDDNDGVPDTVDVAPLNAADTGEISLPLSGIYKGLLIKRVIQ